MVHANIMKVQIQVLLMESLNSYRGIMPLLLVIQHKLFSNLPNLYFLDISYMIPFRLRILCHKPSAKQSIHLQQQTLRQGESHTKMECYYRYYQKLYLRCILCRSNLMSKRTMIWVNWLDQLIHYSHWNQLL